MVERPTFVINHIILVKEGAEENIQYTLHPRRQVNVARIIVLRRWGDQDIAIMTITRKEER